MVFFETATSSIAALGWDTLGTSATDFLASEWSDATSLQPKHVKHGQGPKHKSELTFTLPWSQPKQQHQELSLTNPEAAFSWNPSPTPHFLTPSLPSVISPLFSPSGHDILQAGLIDDFGAATTQEILDFVSSYDDKEIAAVLAVSFLTVAATAGAAGLLAYFRLVRKNVPASVKKAAEEPANGKITRAQQSYNLTQTVEIIGRVFGDFFKGWGVYQTNWAKMSGRAANSELAQFCREMLYTTTGLAEHLPDWLNFTKLIPESFRNADLNATDREGLTFRGATTGQVNNIKGIVYWIKERLLRGQTQVEAHKNKEADLFHFANTLKKISGESLLNWAWGGEKLCNVGFFLSSLAAVTTGQSEFFYAGATCLFAGRVLDVTGFVGSMYATPAVVRDNEHQHAKEQFAKDVQYPCWDTMKLVEATLGSESEEGGAFLAEQLARRQEAQARLLELQIKKSEIRAQLQWIPGLPHPVNNALFNEAKVAQLEADDADLELQMTMTLHSYYRVSAERVWDGLLKGRNLGELGRWLAKQERELIATIRPLALNEFKLKKDDSENLKRARHCLISVRATAELLDVIYDKAQARQPVTTDDLVKNWIDRAEETAGRFDSGTTQFAVNRFFDGMGKIPLSAWAFGYGAWELLHMESGSEVANTLNGSAPVSNFWFYSLAATQAVGPILGFMLNTKNHKLAEAEGDTSNMFYYRMGRWSQAFMIASMITFVMPETKPFGIGLFGAIGNILTLAQQRFHNRKKHRLIRSLFQLLGVDKNIDIEEPQIGVRYLRPRTVLN